MNNTGLEYRDYLGPLQKAIFARLDTDIAFNAFEPLSGDRDSIGLFDQEEENEEFPYVIIGEQDTSSEWPHKGIAGVIATTVIHIYSQYQGMRELQDIGNLVLTALTRSALDLSSDGFKIVTHSLETVLNFEEAEGKIRHSIIRLRYRIQDAQTVQ